MTDQQPQPPPKYDGELTKHHPAEIPWKDRYDSLKDHGYILRPRYRPGWTPSWPESEEYPDMRYEDALLPSHSKRLDAERVADGKPVFLKLAPKSSPEIDIGRLLVSPDLLNDPRNRCAPLLDVLEDPVNPEGVILVFPLLRRLDNPRPATIGEFVPMIQQTLEILAFLHENEIAHRDCAYDNIMMDARVLYPEGWHPQSYLHSREFPRSLHSSSIREVEMTYYFIDFGLATHGQNQTTGLDGQERAPELSDTVPYNPYKLDVYILGMAFWRYFNATYALGDFKPLQPITDFMTASDPSMRPTARESCERFKEILATIPEEELSRRLSPRQEETFTEKLWNDLDHFIWTKFFSRWVAKRKSDPLICGLRV